MNRFLFTVLVTLLFAHAVAAQAPAPIEPRRDSGDSVAGAFEGWFKNADGTFSLLVGYVNRNLKQDLDIPVGPNNTILPGGPDRGQPTHFNSGRQRGVFVIIVPKDFGDAKLTWTLVAHGETTSIPLSLNSLSEISPFSDAATGNTPPQLTFDSQAVVEGPISVLADTLKATVGKRVFFNVSVLDDAKVAAGAVAPTTPAASITWSKFRGPGAVKIGPSIVRFTPPGPIYQAHYSYVATFSEPGEYTLLAVANDWSSVGGGACCWTTAQVKVTVGP